MATVPGKCKNVYTPSLKEATNKIIFEIYLYVEKKLGILGNMVLFRFGRDRNITTVLTCNH